ncbi:MAG: hypothetical protein EA364_13110 [Balneolaceae bacterium]|nr:MAG: hypothetical protein EA364_13110 [Balneolaceae bacterium]
MHADIPVNAFRETGNRAELDLGISANDHDMAEIRFTSAKTPRTIRLNQQELTFTSANGVTSVICPAPKQNTTLQIVF